jgi:hypothetical protein
VRATSWGFKSPLAHGLTRRHFYALQAHVGLGNQTLVIASNQSNICLEIKSLDSGDWAT